MEQPSSQSDSGLQENHLATATVPRRNQRNLGYIRWSVAEKEILHYCSEYSKYDKWSRKKGVILEERIREAELPPEKKAIPLPKIRSTISQLLKYVSEEKLVSIREKELQYAE